MFEGACTAIITPFCADGIDYPTLDRQLDFQIENDIAAIVVAGTTGENATLEIHEYAQLVDFSIRKCSGKIKVIAGIGGNNTASCLKKAKIAKEAGVDGVLQTAPYYNKTSHEGLSAHFLHVADNVDIPLILYNVPSRTSIGIGFETYNVLSRHPNINGTKEASGNLSLIGKLLSKLGDKLTVWSGNDDNTVALMSMGAKGVISVASNIIPLEMSKICSLCLDDQYKAAFELFKKYQSLIESLFIEVNPIPIKYALRLIGMDKGNLRLPLQTLCSSKSDLLKSELREIGLI